MSRTPSTVGGRYRLGALLRRGGMATVYRGHDDQLDRPVAVKLMRDELGDEPTTLRRFEAEARRAASVAHPNLVTVYDVGVEDGVPYIVMELVEGGDLAAALARERPMAPERAARVGVDVASALEVAHGAGLVHRDVKPGNILLEPDGRARVTDFGIARATGDESLTRTGAIMGSVEYFSPEQARGERATPASDVYGLGAVLYELLTGQRPFTGDTPYAVATARLRQQPPDARAANPSVPEELAAIVRRAMARGPDERYASAAELRAALEAWLEEPAAPIARPGTEQLRTPPRAAATTAPARSGRPGWAVLAIPVAAVVAIGFLGWLGAEMLSGDGGIGARPFEIIAGEPGGSVLRPTDSPSTPTVAPSAGPSASAAPTESAEPAAPSPSPTVTAARSPAPVPAAPPADAPTAAPTPAVVAIADSPADAVAAFYRSVADGSFDTAYTLWSQRMKDTYPRQENLDGRFAETASISFTQLEVVDQTSSGAAVQANFVERYDGGGSRQFIGYWRLVRAGDTWLLHEPNY